MVNEEVQTVTFIPSREDSYERLLETDKQFSIPCQPVEEAAVLSVLLEEVLHCLSPEEQKLIRELYFLEKTERQVSEALHMAKTTLRRRHQKVLDKLRELLEEKNNFFPEKADQSGTPNG